MDKQNIYNKLKDPLWLRSFTKFMSYACDSAGSLKLEDFNLNLLFAHFGTNGFYGAGHTTIPHNHPAATIECVIDGPISYSIEGESYTIRENEGLILLPGIKHYWSCNKDVIIMGIQVHLNAPNRKLNQITELWGSGCHIANIEQNGDFPALMNELFNLEQFTCFHAEKFGRKLMLLILDMLEDTLLRTSNYTFNKNLSPSRASELCQEVSLFIKNNSEQDLSLNNIACFATISERHLNRIFKEHIGLSVMNYLNTVRLEKAYNLLMEDHTLSVKQVAYLSGFSSASYFSYAFKKHFNRSPSGLT